MPIQVFTLPFSRIIIPSFITSNTHRLHYSSYFRFSLLYSHDSRKVTKKWFSTLNQPQCDGAPKVPLNQMNIQLLPRSLDTLLFPNKDTNSKPEAKIVKLAQQHLKSWDIQLKKTILLPEPSFDLPPLEGESIAHHFYNIALDFETEYTRFLHPYLRMNNPPSIPSHFVFQPGWTKYTKNKPPETVPFPDESVLTFDIEVLYNVSQYPVMATALGANGYYAWVSPWLVDPVNNKPEHLIPLGNRPSLVIGHFVGFDRQAILEEYALKKPKTLFMDTMSLHSATNGMSTQQLARYEKFKKADLHKEGWFRHTSKSSLSDLSEHYLGIKLDKSIRDFFAQEDIHVIQNNFQTLMTYCANDTLTTYHLSQKLYCEYSKKCPHPVSFIGMLMMGSSYLPVTSDWSKFIRECESKVQAWSEKINAALCQLATDALETYIDTSQAVKILDEPLHPLFPLTQYATESLILKTEELSLNPWLAQLDWTLKPLKLTKKGKAMVKSVLPNYPSWFVNLWDSKLKTVDISPRKEVAPLLLQLKWRDYPLVYSKRHKWGYMVPPNGKPEIGHIEMKFDSTTLNSSIEKEDATDIKRFSKWIEKGYTFFRLPHKDGNDKNSGTPFSKSLLLYFDQDILHSENPVAKDIIHQQVQCGYWVVASDRIKSQFVVWQSKFPSIPFLDPDAAKEKEDSKLNQEINLKDTSKMELGNLLTKSPSLKKENDVIHSIQLDEKKDVGAILPKIVVMGTLTRRAVEPTWMTASNSKKMRIGSDLKRYVEAPPGYVIVGADVDAEELWILSILGDASFKMHGSTAVSWRNLQGQKSDGTDLHSVTATILGISRDAAKQFNYARYYGAGEKFAIQLLLQNNPNLTEKEVTERIMELYAKTKGKTVRKSIRKSEGAPNHSYRTGGSETFMFNAVESIARSVNPRTPTLHCQIPTSMLAENIGSDYMTTRVNWVIQSSGVDYLHLLITSMAYLTKKYDIQARLMLTIHDEIRYLVKKEDQYRASLALQISNLWTRTLFVYQLGFQDLPLSVAFFSGIDIDHCLRKETNDPCITPTNSIPVPPGKTLTIYDLIENLHIKTLGKPQEWKPLHKKLPEDFFPIKLKRNFAWLQLQMESHSTPKTRNSKKLNLLNCNHGYL